MRTDNIIRQTGLNAIVDKLDIVEIERFIMLFNRDNSDYTK